MPVQLAALLIGRNVSGRTDTQRASSDSWNTIRLVGGNCERCGRPARLRRYCSQCKTAVDVLKPQYVQAATRILATGTPLGPEWAELEAWRRQVELPTGEAHQEIVPAAADWLRRYAAFAASDDDVTAEELSTFRRAAALLNADQALVASLDNQLQRAQAIGNVRAGHLPRVSSDGLHLPTDEHCYLNIAAIRVRYLKSGLRQTHGQLVVTNRKVRFIAYEHGGEIPLSKVMSALDFDVHDLSLKATSASLSGDYRVADAEWAAEVIDTALRIDRRVLLQRAGRGPRIPIPQHVKTEVWQRDHGQCVECHATDYLEFDHVIPRS